MVFSLLLHFYIYMYITITTIATNRNGRKWMVLMYAFIKLYICSRNDNWMKNWTKYACGKYENISLPYINPCCIFHLSRLVWCKGGHKWYGLKKVLNYGLPYDFYFIDTNKASDNLFGIQKFLIFLYTFWCYTANEWQIRKNILEFYLNGFGYVSVLFPSEG